MDTEEITTPDVLPDEGDEGADVPEKGLKDTLGEALGKEFKSDEVALKAIKDTFSYVGKIKDIETLDQTMRQLQKTLNTDQKGVIEKLEEMTNQTDRNEFVPKGEFEKLSFYQEHPELKEYKNLVETFKKSNPDKSRDEIISSEDFKEVFGKVDAHDKSEKAKSVLKTSSKLGGITDKISEAREAANSGNLEKAEKSAIDAVIEAFPLE